MAFGVRYRESLPQGVLDEFDALIAGLRRFLFREHHADGTHIVPEWQNYQPTLALATIGLGTLGDGLLRGRYLRQGNIVFYDIYFRHGSTTVLDTTQSLLLFTLPIPGNTVLTPEPWIAQRATIGSAWAVVAGAVYIGVGLAGGAYVNLISNEGSWDGNTPDTWVEGNTVKLSGFYPVDPDAAPIGDV